MSTRSMVIGVLAVLLAAIPVVAESANAVPVSTWQNCTHVNKVYPHGVGRDHAHDHTRSGTYPVTDFKHSTKLYDVAMRHNSGLDGDKDGIACEEH